TIALRRAANEGAEAWDRYRAELERQGFDTEGLERPVLVRVRTEAMTGEARAALAREMNADVTERLSVTEQAMADAASLDDAALEILEAGDVGGPGNRAFLARVAGDQANTLADAEGRLSATGVQRLRAAVTARAYGDPRLVEAVFETADGNIKMIGQALADAAPSWARMRAAIARGQAAAELDLTANLRAAVDLVRHARHSRVPLGQLVADRLGQVEMFGGEAIAPETEAFLRLFFRDEAFKRGRAAARVAAALDDYSRRAGEIAPGPDLFGETPDAAAKRILEDLGVRLAAEPDDAAGDLLDRLRDDPPDAPRPAPEPVVLDLRPSRGDGERPGGEGARPEGGGAAEGAERGGLTDGEPAGPAAGPAADGSGAQGAGRGDGQGQGGANPAQAAPDQAIEFPDQAHADLFTAGRRQLAGEAVPDAEWQALAERIGRLIDWTDVGFVTARVRSSFKGDLPPPAVMRRFAQDYARGMVEEPELWSLSLYDPDRIGEALQPVTLAPAKPPPAESAPAVGRGRAIIAADPELKALEEDTAGFIRDQGVELPDNPALDPDVIAEGVRAAAICIKEGWVG
ncbi:MAG TPA: hypothetical protein VEA44_05265, partial [Caulobacter sp.]|nr:hypothetical protein [Caulobacter sp.]